MACGSTVCWYKILTFFLTFSYVGVTGTGEMEVDEVMEVLDPFSQTRLGNENNPFVVDDAVGAHVSVRDDSDDEKEFNDR